jgi:rubredoxin
MENNRIIKIPFICPSCKFEKLLTWDHPKPLLSGDNMICPNCNTILDVRVEYFFRISKAAKRPN